jgi:hypothetical protein
VSYGCENEGFEVERSIFEGNFESSAGETSRSEEQHPEADQRSGYSVGRERTCGEDGYASYL